MLVYVYDHHVVFSCLDTVQNGFIVGVDLKIVDMSRNAPILCVAAMLSLLTLLTFESCLEMEDDLVSQDCGGSCATITGILTTDVGIQPLAGVEVTAKWKHTFYLAGGTIREKAKTRTDAFGKYTLRFTVRDDELNEGYFLFEVLTDEEYFDCGNDEYPSFAILDLKNDTTITQNLFIPYVAYLNIGATGAENMADSDYFSITITPDVNMRSSACGGSMGWKNQDPDWIYNITVPARLNLIIETVINKGQGYQRTYDTLWIDKGQTESFTAAFK